MDRLIDVLLDEKRNGDDTNGSVLKIAEGISEASRFSNFYEMDLSLMSKVILAAGKIEARTARRIIRNAHKKFSKRTMLLLASMDCGEIGISASKIISLFNDIPLLNELIKGIKQLKEENKILKEKSKNEKEKERVDEEEGVIEVDWKYKYKQLEIELKARDKAELEKRIAEANQKEIQKNYYHHFPNDDDNDLFIACKEGNLDKVKSIINASPEKMDVAGGDLYNPKDPMEWAIINGHLDIVKFLTEKGNFMESLMN